MVNGAAEHTPDLPHVPRAVVHVVAACGGLLFGYDLGVAGGVAAMESFQDTFFPSVKHAGEDKDRYCRYSNPTLQLFVSSLFLSGMVASLFAPSLRKRTAMGLAGGTFVTGALLMSTAHHLLQLVVGRALLGVGVGLANQSTPVYLSEIAPTDRRGQVNILFQLATTIGIFAAQCVNAAVRSFTEGWRVSLALAALPALALLLGSLLLPHAPSDAPPRRHLRWSTLFHPAYRPHLATTLLIPFFQQFTGVNMIVFYAPELLENTGVRGATLVATLAIGITLVLSTLVSIAAVERAGRRALLLQGTAQMLVAGTVFGVLLGTDSFDSSEGGVGALLVAVAFVAGFSWSWGPLGWLLPTELNPVETRSAAAGVSTAVNFLCSFLVAQLFLTLLCTLRYAVFFFFAGWQVLMLLFVLFLLPETKGVPLTGSYSLLATHWFWNRWVGSAVPPVAVATAEDPTLLNTLPCDPSHI